MKKKLLTRVNLILGTAIFGLLGSAGCNMVKYGAPEPELEVLYGPPPTEQVEDTIVTGDMAQHNE